MRETSTTEVSAAEAREHLIACVGEMAADLPHVRQRENALLYVRGLVEHGGRKSLREYLEQNVWPVMPPGQLGRVMSREEEDRILGYGPEGY